MHGLRRHNLAALATGACLLALPAMAHGQTENADGDGAENGGGSLGAALSLEDLVEGLDSPHLIERESCSQRILQLEGVTLERIEAYLRGESLSAEQRLRLEQVALRLFFDGPRAAMGIRFGETHPEGCRIGETIQGFHATEVLLPGDVIVEADGRVIAEQIDLQVAILSRSPGEMMQLKVRRAGEPLAVALRLGSFHNLSSAMRPSSSAMLGAWMLRSGRRENPVALEPLNPLPDPEAAAESWPERGTPEWDRAYEASDAPRSVVVGGQPRQTEDLSPRELAAISLERTISTAGFVGNDAQRDARLTILRANRVELVEEITALQRRLAIGDQRQEERNMILRMLVACQERLALLDQQITAIEVGRGVVTPRP